MKKHHAESATGKFTVFVGHHEYRVLCCISSYATYGLKENRFMGQKLLQVREERYFKVAANEHLKGYADEPNETRIAD